MRYSDLAGKEFVCMDEGIRLGVVNQTDLIINTDSGCVEAVMIPCGRTWWKPQMVVIPWNGVKKIGRDLIIVDLSTAREYEDTRRRLKLE